MLPYTQWWLQRPAQGPDFEIWMGLVHFKMEEPLGGKEATAFKRFILASSVQGKDQTEDGSYLFPVMNAWMPKGQFN